MSAFEHYSATAVERAMKVHEVIVRAMSGEIAFSLSSPRELPEP